MQTIYYRTSNFIRHEGNLVDLEAGFVRQSLRGGLHRRGGDPISAILTALPHVPGRAAHLRAARPFAQRREPAEGGSVPALPAAPAERLWQQFPVPIQRPGKTTGVWGGQGPGAAAEGGGPL